MIKNLKHSLFKIIFSNNITNEIFLFFFKYKKKKNFFLFLKIIFYDLWFDIVTCFKFSSVDAASKNHSKNYTGSRRFSFYRLSKILDFLKSKNVIFEKCTFIDIGSGYGAILYYAYKKFNFHKLIGIEINKKIYLKSIEQTKFIKKLKIYNSDIMNYKFNSKIHNQINVIFVFSIYRDYKSYKIIINKLKKLKKFYLIVVGSGVKKVLLKNKNLNFIHSNYDGIQEISIFKN